MADATANPRIAASGAVPDPGGRRRCEHTSSFQRPRLSRFCPTNFMEEGTLVSEPRFRSNGRNLTPDPGLSGADAACALVGGLPP